LSFLTQSGSGLHFEFDGNNAGRGFQQPRDSYRQGPPDPAHRSRNEAHEIRGVSQHLNFAQQNCEMKRLNFFMHQRY
jgi:hypothetical protein